jgi:eukaryotic-like serine/threonine-protein kinase
VTLSPGAHLGPYEIVIALGAGGMGEVYRARDVRLGRDVALKVLPSAVSADPARLERFDREARAVAALNHPHIVTLYSMEEADGVRYLTMELVEGGTLTDLIAAGPVPLARFFDIALALADALSAAHQKQITHRDLKPGNVMVSHEGRVKVLDFGLARFGGASESEHSLAATRAPMTELGMVVGTMPYMSPEQVEGRSIDPRSDLFSLGIILYEMLSGERPFKGGSSPALMSAILRDTPSCVSDARRDVPDALSRLVARCLEKRPDDRVQTARDVLDELRQVQKQAASIDRAEIPRREVAAGAATGALPSIAVLPFSDLSPAKDQDWFCDGIAEEILNALALLPGLHVTARASSFALRGRGDDLRTIGEKLKVKTVLEGSVRRAGDRVRITAQLSDVEQGRQLWSERFDRELKDIFDVQEEIARAIVDRLRLTLSGAGARLVARTTKNLEAYQLLLKGRLLLMRRGHAILDAMPIFEQAIALDPEFAEAHALLADAHRLMALYGIFPAAEGMRRARAAAERALALDPQQIDALATLANIAAVYDWDLDAARSLSDRALAIDPTHVRTLAERAIVLRRFEAQSPELEKEIDESVARARALDPLNAWVVAVEALCHALAGHRQQAVAAALHSVALDGNSFTARWAQVFALASVGRHQEAEEAAVPALAMSDRHPRILAELAAMHAQHGNREATQALWEEVRDKARTRHVGAAEQATIAASAGEWPDARRLIVQAIADRDPYLSFWKLPAWTPAWSDPECAALLRTMPSLALRSARD